MTVAFPAPDNQAVHFVIIGNHQQGAAVATKILVGVGTDHYRERCRRGVTHAGRRDDPELDDALQGRRLRRSAGVTVGPRRIQQSIAREPTAISSLFGQSQPTSGKVQQ